MARSGISRGSMASAEEALCRGDSESRVRCHELQSDNCRVEKQRGLQIKTVRVRRGGSPAEAISFPAFSHKELAGQTWETRIYGLTSATSALFRSCCSGVRRRCETARSANQSSTDRLALIGVASNESGSCLRNTLPAGHTNSLPTAGMTKYIHVKPHGTESSPTKHRDSEARSAESPSGSTRPSQRIIALSVSECGEARNT